MKGLVVLVVVLTISMVPFGNNAVLGNYSALLQRIQYRIQPRSKAHGQNTKPSSSWTPLCTQSFETLVITRDLTLKWARLQS